MSTKTNSEHKLCLNVPEVAELLGVSRPIAYELSRRSDFPKITIGRRIIIPRAGLESWLQKQGGAIC